MPRDIESIELDIENARDQLARTLDELSVRTNPKRLVETTKQSLMVKLNEPAVRYGLVAAGAVVGLLLLRKLLR